MITSLLTFLGVSQTAAKVWSMLIFAALIAAVVIYVMALREKGHKYDALYAQVTALEQKYDCRQRMASQRALPACLEAREKDAEGAKNLALNKVLESTLNAQKQLDEMNRAVLGVQESTEKFIRDSPMDADGDLPKVVLDYWERERARLGAK